MKKNLIFIILLVSFLVFSCFSLFQLKSIVSFLPQSVYAQPTCISACNPGYCCETACCYGACIACSCTCTGDPCPAAIATAVAVIVNNYNEITASRDNLVDLIEERTENRLRISNIFEMLGDTQKPLRQCFNPIEKYDLLESMRSTSLESLSSCSYALQFFAMGNPLFGEDVEEITECYGPTEAESDKAEDFFCCSYDVSFEDIQQ
jgi:hypothetical protein